MKLNIDQSNLAYALSTVSRAISGKPSIPILNGIKIESTGESIICQATDLEISLMVSIPASFCDKGQMVVPGKNLAELVKRLSNAPLEIESDESRVTVRSQKSIYDLPVFAAEEYPELTAVKGEKINVKLDELKTAIRKVIFATSPDDPRPFISAILIEVSPGNIRLVGTDVNRLAVAELKAQAEQNLTALLPVRAAKEILNLSGDTADIIVNDKQLQIESGGVTLMARLANAQYPRYEQVIPKDCSGSFGIDREEFVKALERVSLITQSVKLDIKDNLDISAKEQDKGKASEQIEIEQAGEQMSIGFNVKFLLDFLKAAEADRIAFQYIGQQRPVMIELDNYKYVVMPLKLEA